MLNHIKNRIKALTPLAFADPSLPVRRKSAPGKQLVKKLTLAAAMVLGMGVTGAQGANRYWDTSAGLNNGVGGSGNWKDNTSTVWSTTSTGDTTLTTAANTDDDIFQGTAGTVTLIGSPTANTLTFNTTGYSITTSGTSTRILTGAITLANNVSLTLAPISAAALTISSITGGTSSGLTVGGSTSASGDAIRINLNSGATIASSAPITISTTGTLGISGFVSNTGTATISAGITNNSGVTTMIGATSGNTLNVNGAITGSAGLQFSAGSSGGAGTINLNAASNYLGATTFNAAATSSTIKLGVDNALPSGTDVTMAASSSNGGVLDLNGHDLTIGSLTSGAGGGSITNNGAAGGTNLNTLTIGGSTNPAAFGLAITDGANRKTSLTRSGTGTTILSGANTYTGTTTVSGGTLQLGKANALQTGNTNSTRTAIALAGGTFNTGGFAQGTSTNTLGALTLSANSTLDLGTGNGSIIYFADSSSVSPAWITGTILTIQNYSGLVDVNNGSGTAGTAGDAIFFGNSKTALTPTQLSQIQFLDPSGYTGTYDAYINSSGEVFAEVPEPATIFAGLALLSLVGWRERGRLRRPLFG